MGAIERLREAANTAKFVLLHSTTPDIASGTRNVCLKNQVILNELLQSGVVTQDRLEEMSKDKKLQNEYRKLLVKAQNGGSDTAYASLILREYALFNHELFAGWLQFFRSHHEWKWGLKLLSPEEEDITKVPTP